MLGILNFILFAIKKTMDGISVELIEEVTFDESARVRTSLTKQLAIIALQKVDIFAPNQQIVLSRLKDIPARFSKSF